MSGDRLTSPDAPVSGRRGERWLALVPGVLAVLVTAGTLVLTFSALSTARTITSDLAIYALPGAQAQFGDVYVDYFDVKPPLLFFALAAWMAVAGSSLLGFWVLYAVLIAAMFAAFWSLVRVFVSPWWALGLLVSAQIVIVGEGVFEHGTLQFTPEVIGLFLVFAGLSLALRYAQQRWWLLALASAVVGISAQFKEVFLFAPLALLPVALAFSRGRWRGIGAVVVGVVAANVLTVVLLVAAGPGVLGAYIETLGIKRTMFPTPTLAFAAEHLGRLVSALVAWMPLVMLTIAGLIGVTIWMWLRGRRTATPVWVDPRQRVAAWSAWLLLVAMIAGFVWQARDLWSHYALVIVLPLFVVLAALLRPVLDRASALPRGWHLTVVVALALALVANPADAVWAASRAKSLDIAGFTDTARTLESRDDLRTFAAISDATDPDACIHVAYGWSAADYYLYSGRRPCSRFFIPPLALPAAQNAELRADLVADPPALLVIDDAVLGEGGTSTTIDADLFPFHAVAAACYTPIDLHPTLHLARFADPGEQRGCIETTLTSLGVSWSTE